MALLITGGKGFTVKVTLSDEVFNEAVSVALCVVVAVPAVAVKVAEVAVAGTVTEAGTVTAELLLARVTVLLPVGAA